MNEGIEIRKVGPQDAEWVLEVLRREWAGPLIERVDEFVDASTLPALVAESGKRRVGLATLLIHPDHLEVVTINSFEEDRGVGTALLAGAESEAARQGLNEVRLFSVNSNIRALRFYQRRGFRMWAIHRDTITRARLVKPMIPEFEDGIPMCDEVELRKQVGP